MYCQTCGASNSDDAKFCNQCGGSIARAGDVGGPKPAVGPGATAVGIGGGSAPIAAPGSTGSAGSGTASGSASTGSAKPGAAVNVWEQQQTSGSGGGPSMMSVSLETIGVRSTKKVWAGIGLVALLLIALGALGSWLLRAEPEVVAEAGHAQPEDPFVIGTPLPPEAAPAPSETEVEDTQGSSAMSGTMTATMSSAMSGTTSGTTTMTSSGSDTSAMTASTMSDSTSGTGGTGSSTGTTGGTSAMDTGSTVSMTGTTDTSMTGATDTSMTDTTSMDTGSTGGSTGSGSTGGTPPNLGGDLPEERDLELELYGSRVRFVVQRYYAARAQTCFDRATRNNPSVSGTVVVNMTIGAEGNVSNTSTARNTTGDEVLGNCLRSQVASWQLPPPPGGSLEMQMPFSR